MRMDAELARLLCARLCHDLGGVAATLAGTLDILDGADAELLGLTRETAYALRGRLRLYAAAWAGAAAEGDAAALADLLASAPAAARVRFNLTRLAPGGALPAAVVPLALNGALLAAEALPRGGTITLSGSAERGLVLCPAGRDAAWPPGLLGLLAGGAWEEALREGPRRLLAPLLLGLAAEAGWAVALAQGSGEGLPPLLLSPA